MEVLFLFWLGLSKGVCALEIILVQTYIPIVEKEILSWKWP